MKVRILIVIGWILFIIFAPYFGGIFISNVIHLKEHFIVFLWLVGYFGIGIIGLVIAMLWEISEKVYDYIKYGNDL